MTIAISDLAGELEEGLLAFAVGTGLKVLDMILEHEATSLAGAKGRHDLHRTAKRHGPDTGVVTLGGRQVAISRPRLRSADGASEVKLPTYELASSTELLGRLAMEKMLAKVSTRRYEPAGLEPVGQTVKANSRGTSRSAVSRRFVEATETALGELMAADLSALDLVALMVDGVNFADHCLIVALGIDQDGTKHPLGVVEGDTENATVVKHLVVGLRDRGLEVTKPILCVLDGSGALASAVKAVFDHPVIARCQLHKIRNLKRHLPDKVFKVVDKRMRAAYANRDPLAGQGDLEALARELDHKHPGAAGSLREGLAATFTVARLGSDAGAHASVDQRHRVHDRDQPRPLGQREALERWTDGAALVRGGDDRSQEAVPSGERPPSSEGSARRPGQARRCRCYTHRLRFEQGGGRIA